MGSGRCAWAIPGQRRRVRGVGAHASFDLIDAEYVRDIEPGEMVVIDKQRPAQLASVRATRRASSCIFEYVYFARPDSNLDGISVYEARKNLGRRWRSEHGVDADVVIPVPGLRRAGDHRLRRGVEDSLRAGAGPQPLRRPHLHRAAAEHSPLRRAPEAEPGRARSLEGKRVVVVDDSIVRGTTSRKIVKMLRDAGAKEVHMRISSPPTQWPCYYGIDTPTRSELIANNRGAIAKS